MSQSNRPRGGGASPSPNIIPGVISALVVLLVLGLLGVYLANRAISGTGGTAAEAQPTLAPATLEPLAPTAAPGATAATEATSTGATPAAEAATPAASSSVQTYSAAPPMSIDPAKNYTATITTPRGDIVIKLRPDVAPQTVNNFVFLSREGFYNGLTWHRVIQDFMAQGGDPEGTGGGGAGYNIPAEFTDKILFDKPGLVAMARTDDPNSASSQFFITTAAAPWLDNQYTIFGEVVQGQEIVNGIPLRDPATATTPGEQIVQIAISEE